MRRLWKTSIGILVIGGLLTSASYMALAVYGPQLKQQLLSALNQYLKTRVEANTIELGLWQDFPNLTLSLSNVRINSALPRDTPQYLARFHKVRAEVNPLSLIGDGPYEVADFRLSNGYVKPRVTKGLKVNYQILKNPDTVRQNNEGTTPALDVANITLTNINWDYRNEAQDEVYEVFSRELRLSGQLRQAGSRLTAKGKGLIKTLQIDGQSYVQEKPFQLATTLAVDHEQTQYTLKQGALQLAGADFTVKGSATYQPPNLKLDLSINGKENNLQTFLSLIPNHYRQTFNDYHGKGNFYFRAELKGPVSARQNPRVNVDFGIENGTIRQGNQEHPLKQVHLDGHFTNGGKAAALTSMLELKGFEANLRGRNLYGNLRITNFTDPYLTVHLRGRPRLQDLQALIPGRQKPRAKGDFFIDADFAGRVRHLKQVSTIPKANFKGRLGLEKASLYTPDERPDLKNLNGHFRFDGNDLRIHRLRGEVGKSFFNLDGHLRNLATFMLLPDKSLKVEADLYSKQLYMAPLLTTVNREQGPADSAATFALPDFLEMDLNFSCEEFNYHRFQAKQVQGEVAYDDETFQLRQLDFQAMQGKIRLAGNLKSLANGNLRARLQGSGSGIRIDKLFYQMENFGQQALTHQHLEGAVTSTINLEAFWDPQLRPLYEKLKVTADVEVSNGKLNRFQPMMKLAGLVNVEALREVNFQKLENRVLIRDQEVRIPDMAIKSNAFEARFSGVHHFDNTIDYHLQVNLTDLLFGRKDEYETAFGKVVRSDNGKQLNLFVKMTGPASDPDLQYDRKAVARQLKKNLQQQGKELQKALKNPGKSGSDKDDYQLEWDD